MMSTRSQAVLALTLAAGPLLIANTANAAAATCGQPAQAAVYQTITIPAVDPTYLSESQWIRTVEDQAAYTDYGWIRRLAEYGYTDYGWMRHVVDVEYAAGSPELTHTRREWMKELQHIDRLWGYQVIEQASGWTTVHHDAVTHTEFLWQLETQHREYQWSRQLELTPAIPAVPGTPADGEWHQGPVLTEASDELVPATYTSAVDVPEHTVQQLVQAAWDETVVQTNGYAYVDKHGKLKYQAADWNNGDADADSGWNRSPGDDLTTVVHHDAEFTTVTVPATYKQVVDVPAHTVHHDAVHGPDVWVETTPASEGTPEVPATYTTEYQWAEASPGSGWTKTGAEPYALPSTFDEQRATDQPADGWVKTDQQWVVVDQEASDEQVPVPEVSHWEQQWSETQPTSNHPWVERGQTSALPSTFEFAYVDGDSAPDGDGWSKSGQTWTIVDQQAVADVPEQGHDEFGFTSSATEGPWAGSYNEGWLTGQSFLHTQDSYVPLDAPYQATGVVRDLDPATEIGWTRDSTTSPDGAGWHLTGQEFRHDAVTHLENTWVVSGQVPQGYGWSATETTRQGQQLTPGNPASTVDELVSEAVPAGAPCAPAVVPPATSNAGDGADVPSKAPAAAPAQAPVAAPAASAVPALAFTGTETGNYLAGGLVLVFLGAGITVATRRRQDASS